MNSDEEIITKTSQVKTSNNEQDIQ